MLREVTVVVDVRWRQEGILFNAAKPLVVLVIRQATELIIPRNGSVLPEQKIFLGSSCESPRQRKHPLCPSKE